jgi:hypothetical protein
MATNASATGLPSQPAARPSAAAPATATSADRDGDIDMTRNNADNADSDSDDDEPRELRLQETLKVALPDKYSGNRKELDTFLLQLGMYFRFNADKFETNDAKSLWAASYLRGEAAKWIEPFLADYFENSNRPQQIMATTQDIFGSFEGFRKEIKRVFGDIDAVKTAERRMFALKQTGSAINYSTEFRRHANQTNWGTAALLSHYHRGLKDQIKLELARMGPIDNINDLIEESVRIDNRFYEYSRDKQFTNRGYSGRSYKKNEGRPRYSKPQYNREQSYGDPMELDMMNSKNNLSQEERNRRRNQKLCFECGFPGHQAKDCRKKPQGTKPGKKNTWKGRKQLKTMKRQESDQTGPRHQLSIMTSQQPRLSYGTTEQFHAMISWTACFDDSCLTHRSDKDGAGWYPQKPRKSRSELFVIKDEPPKQGEVWCLEKIGPEGARSWRHKEKVGVPGEQGLWNDARGIQGDPIAGRYYVLELEIGSTRIWRETRSYRGFKEFFQYDPPSKGEAWEVIHQHGHDDQRITLLRDLEIPQRIVTQVFRHEVPTKYIDIPTGRVLRVRTRTDLSTTWEDVIDPRKRFYGFIKGKQPKMVYRNSKRAKQE